MKYKLISKEDLKIDFGGKLNQGFNIPDPDSDLESEINKQNLEFEDQFES